MATVRQGLIKDIVNELILEANYFSEDDFTTDTATYIDKAQCLVDEMPVSYRANYQEYVDSLQAANKRSLFRTSILKAYFERLDKPHLLAYTLNDAHKQESFYENGGAGAMLAHATHAKIKRGTGDVGLYIKGYEIGEWAVVRMIGTTKLTLKFARQINRSILLWNQVDCPRIYESYNDGDYWFERPAHLVGRQADYMANELTDGDDHDYQAERAVGLAEFAVILKPANTVLLFDKEPRWSSATAIAAIPQTRGGSTWSPVFDNISKKWEQYEKITVGSTVVAELFIRNPADNFQFRTPNPVHVHYEIYQPTPVDDPNSAKRYADMLASELYEAGIWKREGDIKVIAPRKSYQVYMSIEQNDPAKRGIRWHSDNDRFELVVAPVLIYCNESPFENAIPIAIAINHSTAHDWQYDSNLFVHDAHKLADWLARGLINANDLKSYYVTEKQQTDVRLTILDPSDDKQTDRVLTELTIIGALIMAISVKFNITRIAAINSNQFVKMVLENLSTLPVSRAIIEFYEALQVLSEDGEAIIRFTNQTRERTYHIQANTPPSDVTPTALAIWQALEQRYDLNEAQAERDFLLEILSVAAFDLAKRCKFKGREIVGKSQQIVTRIVRDAIHISHEHSAAWDGLNATEKLTYLESIQGRAQSILPTATRPDYMDKTAKES